MSKLSVIQMSSTSTVAQNLKKAAILIRQAVQQKTQLVVLPEMFTIIGKTEHDKVTVKEKFGMGPIQNFLREQAKLHKIWIIGGTIPLNCKSKNKIRAASLVINDRGKIVARYDKIHLFDVCVKEKIEEYKESDTVEPGNKIVVIDSPVGKLGLAVCYDIRFPELFRAMLNQGVEIFVIPAAFTVKTGRAHWQLLLKARAVENLCYVAGAAQTGTHANNRSTYGHSMIIDPWGKRVAYLAAGEGVITATIDLDNLEKLRTNLPCIKHKKINS